MRSARQKDVSQWCAAAFGIAHASNVEQRAIRLMEESIEAAQAAMVGKAMLHKLVDYVYDRPVGSLAQELGGVGLTLLAMAAAAGLDADTLEELEFQRVLGKPIAHWNARNQQKNEAGFVVADQSQED